MADYKLSSFLDSLWAVMFKYLKTSTQISLKFTLFSAGILLIIACVMNFFFFSSWYFDLTNFRIEPFDLFIKDRPNILERNIDTPDSLWSGEKRENENNRTISSWEIDENIQRPFPFWNPGNRDERCVWDRCWPNGRQGFNPEQNFPQHRLHLKSDSDEAKDILSKQFFFKISVIDGYYLYVEEDWDSLQVFNVTPQVELQHSLFWISIWMFVIWTLLSYIVSLFFVKSALKKLNTLIEVLDWLDIDHLDTKIPIEWAKDDEINRVIAKFNQSFEKIHAQTLWLKDFVRNASHEMRTPLMWMSTLIDLARKSKNYERTLFEVKNEIKRMDSLLETLLLITRVEEKVELDKEKIDVVPSLRIVLNQLKEEFADKKVDVKEELPKSLELAVHQQWWESIMTNILRNAFKYTDDNWEIVVSLSDKCFKVWNSWEWIDEENLGKIWERFWQWDSSHTDSKSFGLGLYLSKLFATKQWFDLRCESKKWEWVTFILEFN